jgi:glycosyltransferase involved in cell wall biosynthesis
MLATMARFLFVTYHFPPSVGGGIPRVLSFARDLPRYGWTATVLTSPPMGAAAVDSTALASLSSETRILRAYCPLARAGTRGHEPVVSGAKGALRRAARAATRLAMFPELVAPWIPFALREGHRALQNEHHDAVVATYGPPASLLVGSALARAHGLPLVVDFRDLWSDLPFAAHATPAHAALVRAIERRIVAQAAGLVTVSEGMTRHFRERFQLASDRIVTVLNGFDESALALVHDSRSAAHRPFTLCYSGSVYAAYDVSPVARAIRRLADSGTITPTTFRFLTLGNFPRDALAAAGVAEFHDREGFVPREQMFERFGEVDAFLVIENGGYHATMGYPVKVFDYLLTGKPVLGVVAPDGNCARLLTEMGMTQLPENRDDAIAQSIAALLPTHGKRPAAVRIDVPPLSRFRRDHNAAVLAELLDRVVGQRNIDRIHNSRISQRKTSV